MFAGPVFTREATIAPRRTRIYIARTAFVLALLVLISTAWLVLTGAQLIRDVGDMARFGSSLFAILAPLQLALAVFFSALLAAIAVAQEKDRRTLELLLLSNLSNGELVLGCLAASLLELLVLWAASVPVFMVAALFGGVSFTQIGRALAVMLATIMACGSLGSTLALWREKTFQTLALTVLILVLWLGFWELAAAGGLGGTWAGVRCRTWAVALSPWQAVRAAIQPWDEVDPALPMLSAPVYAYLLLASAIAVLLNGWAVVRVRAWNTATGSQQPAAGGQQPAVSSQQAAAGSVDSGFPRAASHALRRTTHGPTRPVWDNPVVWREIRTWAYGRKILLVRLAYLVLFALAAVHLYAVLHATAESAARNDLALAIVPLLQLSLVLVNTQAVTALTAERDAQALDLLLVTDLTPKEIVFGKLGGIFYNAKEMVLLPLALVAYLGCAGALQWENALYLGGALAVLNAFAAMVGVHAGMIYDNTRSAIATSLGTVFFLLLGVATCMRIMIAFSGSFQAQLQPFLAFMLGGGIAMYLALGARNPSTAIGLASFVCPLATFYAITSYLLGYTLAVFLVVVSAYGFATAAMLIPAIYEFDVATGKGIRE